ncbi:MAG: acetyl-CoA carboxylase biotin carboxyl carrier protein subunit, partial [Cyanobacteriota bacterium]|nr:acetyl-CoA carboxylase biotin carboxyl carrier protein subunit [Cyanobacteriota bacterium]
MDEPLTLRAPHACTVVRVAVTEGDAVHGGQGLVLVEAMKMEHLLEAPAHGVVGRVSVAAGDVLEEGQAVLDLVPGEAP